MTERYEMAARHLIGRDAKPLACHMLLELDRKEPIIATYEYAGRYRGPTGKVARRVEHRLRLARLALRPGLVDHRLRVKIPILVL